MILFTAATAIAIAKCESEADALFSAIENHAAAGLVLAASEVALVAAIRSGNLLAIGAATVAVLAATVAYAATGAQLIRASRAYFECVDMEDRASGGCDS